MQAIIIAGGFGTRLREVLVDLPKAMAPIGGRPFLTIVLDNLVSQGFTRVVLSVGFMGEKIRTFFGENYKGMKLCYAMERSALGTGGGTRLAMEQITCDHVFVLNGDTFLDFDAALVEQQWKIKHRPIIIGRKVADSLRYGRLHVDAGAVCGLEEKGLGGPGMVNAGCYVLRRNQLDFFQPGFPFSLELDYLKQAIVAGEFDVHVSEGRFIDIGTPEDFARAQLELGNNL